MAAAVDTISTQVVIAGPSEQASTAGKQGPVVALTTSRQAIPRAMKQKIAAALRGPKMIDPTLPGESVGIGRVGTQGAALNPAPEVSLLTALVLFLFAFVFAQVFRKDARQAAGPELPRE